MTSPSRIPRKYASEALFAVYKELSRWREKHGGRGRIPEHIWDRAVAVACIEGSALVGAVLQLPIDSLAQRVLEAEEPLDQTETAKFVELTAEVCTDDVPSPVAVIEMTGPHGEYLRVELSPDAWEAGGIVVDTFLAYLERP